MSDGSFAPRIARCAMIASGMSVNPEVCSTRNMIWALLASSLFGFRLCRLSIAFRPKGVAALSRPSRLAEKFITMWPVAGWSFGTSGKMREKNGEITFANQAMAPAFSPMFMMPSHSVITPASGRAMSITPMRAASKVPSMTFLKISVSPRKSHWAKAAAKPTRKKPDQM
mgnify:CR=1 FL=1